MSNFLAVILFIASPIFAQEHMEVFTESPIQLDSVPGISVIHYDLSEPARIKKQSAPKLPADEKIALAQAKAFFKTAEGNAYKSAMRDAYRGKQKMMQYQLTKIPAIVFEEGKYVIYGSTDVVQATTLYRNHIQSMQDEDRHE